MSTATVSRPTFAFDQAMLDRFRERAPVYDRENRFFQEDFDELKQAGYLTLPIPADMGGPGLSLTDVGRLQRQLARYAPADAIAVNMHLCWVGTAANLHALGDPSLDWLLEEALAGELFAAGHAERGNDLAGLYSSTRADRVDGGYRFFGHKSFGTLTPVWTRLGMWGMDSSDPANRKMVHAFMNRDTPGFRIDPVWDSLGMRATRSDDTILDGAFVPDHRIARVLATGAGGMDAFLLTAFHSALTGFGNVYLGIAQRALELTIENVKAKSSLALPSGTMEHHPGIQNLLADMIILLNAMEPHVESVAQGWVAALADAANWSPETPGGLAVKLLGMKMLVTDQAFRVVDMAVEAHGGFGVSRHSEIERLFRDSRMGKIHPTNSFLTREMVSKMSLGLDFDAAPRWG